MLLPLKQHHLPHNGPSDSVQLAKWCHLPDLLRRHDCVQVARGLGVHCPNLRARARRAKQCGLCEQVATEGPKAAAGWEAFLERMHFPACVLAELGAGEAQGLQTLVDSTDDTGHRCRLTAALREPCWKRPAPPPTRPWGLWAWNGKSWLDAVTVLVLALKSLVAPRAPAQKPHPEGVFGPRELGVHRVPPWDAPVHTAAVRPVTPEPIGHAGSTGYLILPRALG